jgi:flagellar protein FlgJ
MDRFTLPAPGLTPSDLINAKAAVATKLGAANKAKAKETAENFEAVFLNSMFQQMFTDAGGDGPLGGKGATGVWRSMLTDEYARSFAKSGGVGIADSVYSALIAQQEMR